MELNELTCRYYTNQFLSVETCYNRNRQLNVYTDSVVCINGRYGVKNLHGETIIPIEYEAVFLTENTYAVKKNGKYGAYQKDTTGCKLVIECEMDDIFIPEVMGGLILFIKNGKYGWYGCLSPEDDSEPIWDDVMMPTKEYFYSKEYGEDTEEFIAVKDGQPSFIEYWTCK